MALIGVLFVATAGLSSRASADSQKKGGQKAVASAAPRIAGSVDSPPAPSGSAAAPRFAWQGGPKKVDLGHDLTLDLPGSYMYLDHGEGARFLEEMGNFNNDSLLAVITTEEGRGGHHWLATVRYADEGYVKDDEGVDGEEILKAIREGTAEGNKERETRGFKPLHVAGWLEAPHYDKTKHHLIWALDLNSDDGRTVNYNTRMLGRKGFVALNLVTDPEFLAADKPEAMPLLEATHFAHGSRYEDFDPKNDKVAEYGLAGLVVGGAGLAAAKVVKIGLLAKFGKVLIGLLIAGKKLIFVAVVAVAALAKKIFSRRQADPRQGQT